MQTAARAARSTARAVSRSPNGSLPFVRENCTSPTTVSRATIGTASVECTTAPSSARSSFSRPGMICACAVRSAPAHGELNG